MERKLFDDIRDFLLKSLFFIEFCESQDAMVEISGATVVKRAKRHSVTPAGRAVSKTTGKSISFSTIEEEISSIGEAMSGHLRGVASIRASVPSKMDDQGSNCTNQCMIIFTNFLQCR
mmetsp:Transcript_38999/g.90763  ORF Transcript_38999/g.90763 Transcript_38999/m.90763 type:complete len:118 (+) Transcript_38999:4188-4541(+)